MLALLFALLGLGTAVAAGSSSSSKDAGVAPATKPTSEPKPTPAPVESEPTPAPVEPEPTPVVVGPEPEPTLVEPAPEPTPAPIEPEPAPVVVGPEPALTPAPVVPAPEPLPIVTSLADADLTDTVVSSGAARIDLPDSENIVSVKIVSAANHGNVTVNADNSLAVVLTDPDDLSDLTFTVEALDADGKQTTYDAKLNVEGGMQADGWGEGDFYMLETDSSNSVVVEHGDNHREVYVSGSDDALTLQDIATLEGISVSKVNAKFFRENTEYGSSEDNALAEDAGSLLWQSITGGSREPSSDWLLFERGYEYDNMGRIIEAGTTGESELHPIYFGAYGDGDKPVLNTVFNAYQEHNSNIVVQGLELSKATKILTSSENILFDNVTFGGEINVQNSDGFTLHNSAVYDVFHKSTKGSNPDEWSQAVDRISGIFVKGSEGVLISDTLFDHNGWADGYDYDLSTDDGQPPSFYSHNVYIQYNNDDVTFRDNITMRGASFGAQIRSGGFIEDNVFLDNNAAVNFLGGDYKDRGHNGEYTLFSDNVITSAAYKTVDVAEGALSVGVVNEGEMSVLKDNIITHLADPNNPSELDYKYLNQTALNHKDTTVAYDDTIIYNWIAAKGLGNDNFDRLNHNTDGLDYDTLNQTTIQLFTAAILSNPDATIADLADYLRAQADGDLASTVDADAIIDFFQNGFGISPDDRSAATTLRFEPNELAEGFRWDNRLNWNTEDLPGAQDGDSVDLAGNWVQYGGTTTLEDLDFGEGGKLNVTHGFLQVSDSTRVGEAGAELNIDASGQVWLDGYTDNDLLTINASGGRLANTDLFTGTTELNITDNAQVILATSGADFALNENSTISITGDDAKVGFDADDGGVGVLMLADDATLSFTAQDGLGEISEFRSGKFEGDSPDIRSGVNLGDAELRLDISELTGGAALSETLIEVDEIIGTFGSIDVTGLGGDQDVTVTVDYEADTVVLSLGAAGSGTGQVQLLNVGDEVTATLDPDLWTALTNGHGIYPDDPIEDIPADDDAPLDF